MYDIIDKLEDVMFILKNEIQFDTAHYLSGYEGKCSNIHGHRYRLVVELASDTLHQSGQQRGMLLILAMSKPC